jgi:hypothetical protein
MKNFKKNLILIGMFFAVLFTFFSCTEESDPLVDQIKIEDPDLVFLNTTEKVANNVFLVNGILNFENAQDFRSTLLALNRMGLQGQLEWGQKLGFKSMLLKFNNIMLSEHEQTGNAHSDLYNEGMQTGFIVNDEQTGLYKLAIFNPAYAPVLNEQGLVLVDNVLYQFDSNVLKSWNEPDLNNLETIFSAATSSENISVLSMQVGAVEIRTPTKWEDQCFSSGDNSKMIMSGMFFSDFMGSSSTNPPSPDIIFIDYAIHIMTIAVDSDGNMDFDMDAVFNLNGNSSTDFHISDGNIEFIKTIENDYDFSSIGAGNFVFIPEVAGVYKTQEPWYFVNPARLMEASWSILVKTSKGEVHECEIGL